jgi:hypothetical protein
LAKSVTLESAVAAFGASAKAKLANPAVTGQPEDQLRAPLEGLIKDLAELCHVSRSTVTPVGESSLSSLKTRPDYAITRSNALVGFLEVKAPGKGADPRKFKDLHDKQQWDKLRSLPNLIYTDGNAFGLWQSGTLAMPIVELDGNVESAGAGLTAPASLVRLFEAFLEWEPIPPRDARQLAELTARLCRLLRDEVTEQLSIGSPALTALASDWRKLLFPEASDEQFADGYAQAVTFGLLMARARGIELRKGLDQAAKELGRTSSLIGTALRILTDDAQSQETLKTSVGTLIRVLDAVHWDTISKGSPDAWLYFYEDFLEVYDNALRKRTGSYYTPPEVVGLMVRLVDEALVSRFGLHAGLASPNVTIADPAVGTGTFLLGALRRIAQSVEADEGLGAVAAAIDAAVRRLIAFEIQLGPFAVAQLRVVAELVDLIGTPPTIPPRMFVTDTLGNPYIEQERLGAIYEPIARSRREANEIKRNEPIMVVVGNPPYKEKAKGRGGWIEKGSPNDPDPTAPLAAWIPPREWGVGAHAKHLRNLYVYFWRWATWKVFDHDPNANTGIVCFITVAGFLNGPGFEKMRDYLRRTAGEIWVIDCSPEGHQPEVNTRIFEAVQQPVCIVLAARPKNTDDQTPATVRFRALPLGHRRDKFAAMGGIHLDGDGWSKCSDDWRAPFLPASVGAWSTYPELDNLFIYSGSGVMPGRTWVIAPDIASLEKRWQTLVDAPKAKKVELFYPHLVKNAKEGELGDRHPDRVIVQGLPGYPPNPKPVAAATGPSVPPVRYGFRSFDRQWIIPDNRLINRPNPELWRAHSERQVYLTALTASTGTSPSSGPAITFTSEIPDLHHYKGSFGGRVFPLWLDRDATFANMPPGLLEHFGRTYGQAASAEDVFAYLAAVAAHPAFTARFRNDLVTPGLRIPLTAEHSLFREAVDVGRTVIWLHTFGERFADGTADRPARPPRMPATIAPRIPAQGVISGGSGSLPETIDYDPTTRRLLVGKGFVENVSPEMWRYEVSGIEVLRHWFSYRKAMRERPVMGDRRPPSKLSDIQPDHWLAEYTTELIDLLNVLGRLVDAEPQQATLLQRICDGPTLALDTLRASGVLTPPATYPRTPKGAVGTPEQGSLGW